MQNGKQLNERLKDADIQQVNQYLKMFDRMLLYSLSAHIMSKESLENTIALWSKVVKKNINTDSNTRTIFLEETTEGRKAKYAHEPDGEELRLHCLKQFDLAQDIVRSNLFKKT